MGSVCHLQATFVRNPCKLIIVSNRLATDSKCSNVLPDTGDPLYLAGGQPRSLSTTVISRNPEEDLDPADDGQVFKTCFFTETPSSFARCSFCGSKCKRELVVSGF
jgi:hypothetical protein